MSLGNNINFSEWFGHLLAANNSQNLVLMNTFQLVADPKPNSLTGFDEILKEVLSEMNESDREYLKLLCDGISLHFLGNSVEANESVRTLLNNNPPRWVADFAKIASLGILWSKQAYQHFFETFSSTVLPKALDAKIATFIREKLTKNEKKQPDEKVLFDATVNAYYELCESTEDVLAEKNILDRVVINYNPELAKFNAALIRAFFNDPTNLRLFELFVNVNAKDPLSYGLLAEYMANHSNVLVSVLFNIVKYQGASDAYKIFTSTLPHQLILALGKKPRQFKDFSQFFTLIRPLNLSCEAALIKTYLKSAKDWEIVLEPALKQKLEDRLQGLPQTAPLAEENFKAIARSAIEGSHALYREMRKSDMHIKALRSTYESLYEIDPALAQTFLNERLDEFNLIILAQFNQLWLEFNVIQNLHQVEEMKKSFNSLVTAVSFRGHIHLLLDNLQQAKYDLTFALNECEAGSEFEDLQLAALGYLQAEKGNFEKSYRWFAQACLEKAIQPAALQYLELSNDIHPDCQDESSAWNKLYEGIKQPPQRNAAQKTPKKMPRSLK